MWSPVRDPWRVVGQPMSQVEARLGSEPATRFRGIFEFFILLMLNQEFVRGKNVGETVTLAAVR